MDEPRRRAYCAASLRHAVLRVIRRERQYQLRTCFMLDLEAELSEACSSANCDTPTESLLDLVPDDALGKRIRSLATRDYHILQLSVVGELTDAEIGKITGESSAAVKKRRQRALARLRAEETE